MAEQLDSGFLMVVRDVFRVGGDRGTVVTGRVESGTVHVGDAIDMVIGGVPVRTRVLAIEFLRKPAQQASVGEEVAVAIADVDGVFVHSRDVIRGV